MGSVRVAQALAMGSGTWVSQAVSWVEGRGSEGVSDRSDGQDGPEVHDQRFFWRGGSRLIRWPKGLLRRPVNTLER